MRWFNLSTIQPPLGDIWEAAKAEKNWLAYRLVEQGGKKPKKIPQSPMRKNVGPKEAACLTFDEACGLASQLGPDCGIGYLPRDGSAMVCVDFDGVLEDGEVTQEGLPTFTSYAERSPSGTGLHVLVERPTHFSPTTFDDGNDWVGFIGSDSKFFTVSMDRWGATAEITKDEALVQWVLARRAIVNGKNAKREETLSPEARESLQRLHKGDRSSHWFYRLPAAARAKCAHEMLATLPLRFARSYDTWIKVGMAFKLADVNDELFDAWDSWSQTAPNYDGKTDAKWASFVDVVEDRPSNATIRTVIKLARQHGWDPAPWQEAAEVHDRDRARTTLTKINDIKRASLRAVKDGVKRRPAPAPEQIAGVVPEHLTRPGGLVEALIDYGAAISPRETRLPALAGALAATSALTNRRYIIVTPGFHTSPGLQVVLVSETGTGKEVARDILYAVCALRSSIAMADSYASAPALHLALTASPTQLWANDEFGRYMKVAANANGGSAHDFVLITMAMKLHTMFEKYLPKKVYSQGADRDRVDHPLLVAMHTTTPKALFDALNTDAVVDGMLGRLLLSPAVTGA